MEIDCLNCQHDYWCCIEPAIILSRSELQSGFFKGKIKITTLTENSLLLGYVAALVRKVDNSCLFFDNKNKICSIYENRPQVCSNFTCIGRL